MIQSLDICGDNTSYTNRTKGICSVEDVFCMSSSHLQYTSGLMRSGDILIRFLGFCVLENIFILRVSVYSNLVYLARPTHLSDVA